MTQSYWGDGAIQTKPELTDLKSYGYPTNGDRSKGVRATQPSAAWFYMMSLMRSQVIAACGKTDAASESLYFECLKSFGWVENGGIPGAKIADASITPQKISADFSLDDLPEALLNALMPAGQYLPMAGTALPYRSLVCDGSAVSRTTYSRLFAAIGTKYGAGDGSTTFNLPDVDGRVLEGTTVLSEVGTYLEEGLPNISGEVLDIHFGGAPSASGCHTFVSYGNTTAGANVTNWKYGALQTDQSKANAVFSGNTVQPASCLSLVAIRY